MCVCELNGRFTSQAGKTRGLGNGGKKKKKKAMMSRLCVCVRIGRGEVMSGWVECSGPTSLPPFLSWNKHAPGLSYGTSLPQSMASLFLRNQFAPFACR